MCLQIAIIGAGGVGARHLQGLVQLEKPMNVQVVDVSTDSLSRARELYEQVPHPCVESIRFCTDIQELEGGHFDVVIVATASKPRKNVIKELLSKHKVDFLILEKVLFQTIKEYDEVSALLSEHSCLAYINCCYRAMPSYAGIKSLFAGEEHIDYFLTGGNWGLGCNGIHYVDLMAYITGCADGFTLDATGLDKESIASKRSGYREFTGTLTGYSPKCRFLFLASGVSDAPTVAEVQGANARCIINEYEQKAFVATKENGWRFEEIDFPILYQSQLTDKLIAELLDTGKSSLPTYEESKKLHIAMISAFLEHINKNSEETTEVCPIT